MIHACMCLFLLAFATEVGTVITVLIVESEERVIIGDF